MRQVFILLIIIYSSSTLLSISLSLLENKFSYGTYRFVIVPQIILLIVLLIVNDTTFVSWQTVNSRVQIELLTLQLLIVILFVL